jgi:hypothetical protein
MATAPKTGALSYYAGSPEEEASAERLRQAQAALQSALVDRRQLFDPVLLAMAQGFLAPTRSGSFGESIANVAGAVGPVQAAEDKRAREIAQLRYELAAQEHGMTQQTRRQRSAEQQMRRLTGEEPAAAPAQGITPVERGIATGAPSAPGTAPAEQPAAGGAASAAPSSAATGGLRPIMELEKLMKSQRDRIMITQGGLPYDRVRQQYVGGPIPSQDQKAYRTAFGQFYMLPWQHDMFIEASQRGKGKEWMERFQSTGIASSLNELPAAGARAPGATGAVPGAAPRMRTVEEERAEESAQKILAEERAKGMAKRTEEALNAGEGYAGRMAIYNSIGKIASRPDASKIFGLLERPGVPEAILGLVRDTIKTPGSGSSISVPGLESALRYVGLDQNLINQYQFALSQFANLQLMQSRITEGQGAVSDRERELFATAAITSRDNPATINAKLDMYRARTELDRDIANELRKSGMTIDQFKIERKDWYDSRVERYLGRVESIVDKLSGAPGAPVKRGPAAVAPSSNAGQALRQELGIK